jgi:hypothetical protein
MPKASKYNWEMIKDWYVTGKFDLATGQSLNYTYQDVCDKWGMKDRSNVKRHADKGNWNEERAAYKEQLRATISKQMREVQIPDIVKLKRTLININYQELAIYLEQLNAREIDIKPSDAKAAARFLLDEYHYLFGNEEPAKKLEVTVDFKDKDDIYSTLARLRNGDN